MAKIPNFFNFDPIWLCLTSIQSIGAHLFFFIKELWVNYWITTLQMAIFQPRIAQKWPLMAKIPNFLILIKYDYALGVSSSLGRPYSFLSRNHESIYWKKTLKMAIFKPKMALYGQNSQFFIFIQYDYALRVSS